MSAKPFLSHLLVWVVMVDLACAAEDPYEEFRRETLRQARSEKPSDRQDAIGYVNSDFWGLGPKMCREILELSLKDSDSTVRNQALVYASSIIKSIFDAGGDTRHIENLLLQMSSEESILHGKRVRPFEGQLNPPSNPSLYAFNALAEIYSRTASPEQLIAWKGKAERIANIFLKRHTKADINDVIAICDTMDRNAKLHRDALPLLVKILPHRLSDDDKVVCTNVAADSFPLGNRASYRTVLQFLSRLETDKNPEVRERAKNALQYLPNAL